MRLGNVFPSLTTTDTGDVATVNSVVFGESLTCQRTSTDGYDVGLSESCPIRSRTMSHPSFLGGILHVIRVGSKKQMFWIDARRNVAAMADDKSTGDCSVPQYRRETVRGLGLPVVSEGPVAIRLEYSTLPKPAIPRLSHVNPRPEHSYSLHRSQQPSSHIGAPL